MATVPSLASSAHTRRFLPVIHCVDYYTEGGAGHALANTKIALQNGADGVFLVNHTTDWQSLALTYEQVRKGNPDAWIGVNFLDLTTKTLNREALRLAIKQCTDLSALWMDLPPEMDLVPPWIEVFSGVAFKYRNANADDKELARECDLVAVSSNFATTSGDKTGSPASVEKLQKVYSLLSGRVPLAVASGVDRHNVSEMLPYVTAFLVASSICKVDVERGGHEYLIPGEVATLANLIHGI